MEEGGIGGQLGRVVGKVRAVVEVGVVVRLVGALKGLSRLWGDSWELLREVVGGQGEEKGLPSVAAFFSSAVCLPI